MVSLTLSQFLMLYLWFPLAAVLVFLMLIGRFYEKFSGVRTYFRLFALPLVLSLVSAVRYASLQRVAGDLLADVALGTAGVVLMLLCLRLVQVMILQQDRDDQASSSPG